MDATDDLAPKRTGVEKPFAGYHQVGVVEHLVEPGPLGQHLEALFVADPDRDQTAGQASRRTGTGEVGDVDSLSVKVLLLQALQPPGRQLDLGR